jgi:predicted RNA-binding protein with PUA-like domain
MKTEPGTYSISDLEQEGTTPWEGVRNYAARNHMREMSKGDLVFIYHSGGASPAVVGIAEVACEAYPDSFAWDPDSPYYDPKSPESAPRWDRVDVSFREAFDAPVTLREIKATPALGEMELVRQMRLSVSPVRPEEFAKIEELSRAK